MTDEVRAIDINSLDLEEDEVQFDAAADSTEQPPPVPDGIYRVKPRFAGDTPNWMEKRVDGKLQSLWTKQNVQFVIQAEGTPFDKQVVFGMASTMIMRNGASSISTILSKMGLQDEVGQCRSHKELAQLFERAVEQGRELQIETEWVAQQKQGEKYKTVKRGMRNFPQNGNGEYSPKIDAGGEEVVAQATVKHFLPL
jgi:hypothetical protein